MGYNQYKKKHGMYGTRIHNSWLSMKERCDREKNIAYPRYGGRGIKICKEWYDFMNFYRDMGERPENTSLDRIDNDGNYCKENCRWATRKEQNNNQRNNIIIEHKGKNITIGEYATLEGIKYGTAYQRVKNGWCIKGKKSDKIIQTPQKVKTCIYCGKTFERKIFKRQIEDLTVFKKRKYCCINAS